MRLNLPAFRSAIRRVPVLAGKHRSALLYLASSFAALAADAAVCRFLMIGRGGGVVDANTAGCCTGFLIGWLLDTKLAFRTRYTRLGFAAYFLTFLGSLAVADLLVAGCYGLLLPSLPEPAAWAIAKGVSVVLPFVPWYLLRKKLFLMVDAYEAKRRIRRGKDRGL